jgi:predicted metal-dependent HD superfamily phosphohydrolase
MDLQILAATEAYATDILENQLHRAYAYHTADHTRQVVMAAEEIGQQTGLTESEVRLVKVAAWFHDLGYLRKYQAHEEESVKLAREFLSHQPAVTPAEVERILQLIGATRLDQEPQNVLEKVLKDADLYNLALPDALENSEKIREEWKVFCNREFTNEEWDDFNYKFFKDYEYYTPYARDLLGPRKDENARKLKKSIKKRRKNTAEAERAILSMELDRKEAKLDKLKRKLKKAKQNRPDRGIETMFRTTYRTHINLSNLADNKANILLSINAIIISIVFTSLVDTFQDNIPMVVAGFCVLAVNMGTIVFAILATRPKVSSGVFSREDILNKKTNLLFFGNFYRMDLDDYQWGINQMMNDAEYLYGSMAKDIYFLGKVLAKKFQLLRIAYNIFMYGMGISIAILGFVFFFFS